MVNEHVPKKSLLLEFDKEPFLGVLKGVKARTDDILAMNRPQESLYYREVTRASRRGHVRIYTGMFPMLKSVLSAFRKKGPDIDIDLFSREIIYKRGFEGLAHQLKTAYTNMKDIGDNESDSHYSPRYFMAREM